MASRMRSRRVLALAIVAVLAGSILPVAPAQPAGPVREPDEGARYETHDPISVTGDADLADDRAAAPVLPSESDDGVRSGSGTDDDPYVIARWRIPFDPGDNPAIRIQSTTAHLVIRDIVFVPDEPSISGLNVYILGAENVTIRDLTLPGAQGSEYHPQVMVLDEGVERATVRNVTVEGDGTIVSSDSQQIHLQDLTIRGSEGWIQLGDGPYTLQDIQIRVHDDGGGYAGGAINFAGDTDSCRATVRNLTVRGARGAGVEASGAGCHLTVVDADVTSNHWGAWVKNGATASITSSTFRRVGRSLGARAGFALENAQDVEIEDVTAVGYPEGLTAEDSNFTVRRTGLVSETGGVVVEGACSRCAIHNSSLWSVRNSGPSTVDARWNWWGSASGPDDGAIEGSVLVEPVLSETPEGVAPLPEDAPGLPVPAWVGVLALAVAAVAWARRDR